MSPCLRVATLLLVLVPAFIAQAASPSLASSSEQQGVFKLGVAPDGRLLLIVVQPRMMGSPPPLTVKEARALLTSYRRDLQSPQQVEPFLVSIGAVPCSSGCPLQEGSKLLRERYTAAYGPAPAEEQPHPEFSEDDRFALALKLSTRYMDAGFREAAVELFNDPLFAYGLVFSGVLYMSAWLNPEPFFSKTLAAGVTIVLVATYGVIELRNAALAFMRLYREVKQARTRADLERAAEHFGKAVGGVGLRVLVTVASFGIGKTLPKIPKGGLGGSGPRAQLATAGMDLPETLILTESTQATVVADGTMVIAGAALGTARAAGRGKGICGDGSTPGGKWHHIATIENSKSTARGGPWTPKFEEFFALADLSLNSASNLIYILDGHQGPHPEEYHREVFKRLGDAMLDCDSTSECRKSLMKALMDIADEICTPGTKLNKALLR
jgi:hypothetical protein